VSGTATIERTTPDLEATFYDPAGSSDERSFTPAPRPRGTQGATVALLSNQKRNADKLLAAIDRILREEHGVATTMTEVKTAMSLPAPADQLHSLAQRADALIVAVGDCGSCSATSVMDAIAAERFGIPAVPIVTDSFRIGAETVAEIQGAPGFPVAYVQHPIATLSDDEITARARDAVAAAMRILAGER